MSKKKASITPRAAGTVFSMTNDEESRKEIIELGGVAMMVSLLSSKSAQVIKNACGALLNLANEQESWEQIRDAGGVELLLNIIDTQKDQPREYALGVFVNLANDDETRKIIKENKGIKIISKCLGQGIEELTRCAIGTFGTLAVDHELCEQIRETKCYPHIVEALNSEDEDIIARTSGCLWNLAVHSEESRDELVKLSAHEKACKLIRRTQDPEVYGNLAMFLSILAEKDQVSEIIRETGAIKQIVKGLGSDQEQVSSNCIVAVWNLGHNPDNRLPMKELGVVPGVIDLLDAKDEETVWRTLGAIITIAPNEDIAKEFKECEGIPKLIPFVEDESHERLCLYAVIALAVLAYQDCNKDEIREQGGLGPLIALLATKNEVLMEKLLSGMLNLTLNAENRTAWRQLDGIAPLIELLYHHNPNIQQGAAGVLWNLSNDEKNKRVIRELGGLNALLTLIGGGTVEPMSKKVPRAKDRAAEVDDDDELDKRIREAIDGDDLEIGTKIGVDTEENVRESFENYCGKIRTRLKNDTNFIEALGIKEKRILEETTQDALDWLHDNPMASDDEIKEKRKEVEKKCEPIISRVDALIDLEAAAMKLKKRILEDDDFFKKLTPDEKKKIQDLTDELMHWLEENPNATKEEIDRKRKEFDAKVNEILARANAMTDLDDYAKQMRKRLDNDGDKLTEKEKKILSDATQELEDWIRDHPWATKEDIEKKRKEIMDRVDPIMQRLAALEDLEKYSASLKTRRDENEFLTTKEKRIIDEAMDELDQWLRDHPDASKEEIERKKKEIMDRIEPILARAEAMKDLSEYGKNLRNRSDNTPFLTAKEKRIIEDAMNELNEWLRDHPDAKKEEIEKKKKEIMDRLEPIFARANALKELDDYRQNLEKRKDKCDTLLSTKEKKTLEDAIRDLSEWIVDNPDAKKDEIDKKRKQVSEKCEPILTRVEAIADLNKYMEDSKKRKDKFGDIISSKDKRAIDTRLEDVADWIKDHPEAKKEDIEKQKKLLSEKIEPIFDKAQAIVNVNKNCESLKERKDANEFLTQKERKQIDNAIEDMKDWIADHPDATVAEIEKREKEMNDKLEPIFARAEAMESLNDYSKNLEKKLKEFGHLMTPKEKKALENAILDIQDWIKDHPDAKRDEILKFKKNIHDKMDPIINRVESMNALINSASEMNRKKQDLDSHLTDKEKKKIAEIIQDVNDWIKDHPDASQDEIDKKRRDMKAKLDPIFERAEAVAELVDFTEASKKKKEDFGDCLNDKEKKKIDRIITDAQDWLKDHPDAKKSDLEKQRRDLKDNLAPMFDRAQVVMSLKDLIEDIQTKKDQFGDILTKKERMQLADIIEDAQDWLKSNPDAKISDLEKKKRSILDKAQPILNKGDAIAKIQRDIKNYNFRVEALGDNLTQKEKKQVADVLKDLEEWVKDHPEAKAEDIEKKRREAQEKVEKILSRGEAMSDLKEAHRVTGYKKDDLADHLSAKEKKVIEDALKDLEDWIKKNPEAKKEDIEKKMKAFREKVDPIIERAQAMKDFQKNTSQVQAKSETYGDALSSKEKKKVGNQVEDSRDWIKDHPEGKKPDIEKERRVMNDLINPIFAHGDAVLSAKDSIKDVRAQKDALGTSLNAKDKQKLDDLANDFEDWLKDHPDAKIEEIEKQKRQFLAATEPILKKGKAIQETNNYMKQVSQRMDDASQFLSDKERKGIQEVLDELDNWIKANPNATKEEIEKKRKEAQDKIEKLLERSEALVALNKFETESESRADAISKFLSDKEKATLEKAQSDLKEWIATHPDAKLEEIKSKRSQFSDTVLPILERGEALKNLEKLSNDISSSKDYYGDALSEKEKRIIDKAVADTLDWIETHPDALKSSSERQKTELTELVDPIFAKANALMNLNKTMDNAIKIRDHLKNYLTEKEKRSITSAVTESDDWIKDHPNAKQGEIVAQHEKLKNDLEPILARAIAVQSVLDKKKDISDKLSKYSDVLSDKEKKILENALKELNDWLEKNPHATKEQIEAKLREFDTITAPILARAEALSDLKETVSNTKKSQDKFDDFLNAKEKKVLSQAIDELNEWIKDHPDAKKDEIEKKKREFKEKVDPILERVQAVYELNVKANEVKKQKEALGESLNEKEKKLLDNAVSDVHDWIKSNPDAKPHEVEKKTKEFTTKTDPILKKGRAVQNYTFKLSEAKSRKDTCGDYLTPEESKQIDALIKEFADWLKENPNATPQEIEKKQREFESKVNKILSRAEKMAELHNMAINDNKRKDAVADVLSSRETRVVGDKCQDVLDWVEANPKATKDIIEKQLKDITSTCDPILERAEAIKDLNNLVDEIKKAENYLGSALTEKERKEIDKVIQETQDWIKDHPDAKKNEIIKKKQNLQKTIDPLFARATAEKKLETLANDFNTRLNDPSDCLSKLSEKERRNIQTEVEDVKEWMKEHPHADKKDLDKRTNQFLDTVNPLVERAEIKQKLEDTAKHFKDLSLDPEIAKRLDDKEKRTIERAVEEALDFLHDNPNASKEEYAKEISKLETKVKPILDKAEAKKNLDESIAHVNLALNDPTLAEKMTEKEKETLKKQIQDANDWKKSNPNATTEEINKKRSEFEKVANPIVERAQVKKKLETTALDLKRQVDDLNDVGGKLSEKDRRTVKREADDALDWLKGNANAPTSEIVSKLNHLEFHTTPIIERGNAIKLLSDKAEKLKKRLNDDNDPLSKASSKDKRIMEREADDVLAWLAENPNASKDEILARLKKFEDKVNPIVLKREALAGLNNLTNSIRTRINDPHDLGEKLSEKDKKFVTEQIKQVLDWLEANPDATPEQINKVKKDLEEKINPIIERAEAEKNLDDYTKYLKKRLANEMDSIHKLDSDDLRKVKNAVEKTSEWLNKNPGASKDKLDEKSKELDEQVRPIVERADAKESLEESLKSTKEKLADPQILSRIKKDDVKLCEKELKDTRDWNRENPKAPAHEIKNKQSDFEKKVKPIIERAEAQDILETYAKELKARLNDDNDIGGSISEKDRKVINSAVNDALNFLDTNPNATKKEALDKKHELEIKVNPIIQKEEAKRDLEKMIYELEKRLKNDDKLNSRLTSEEKKKYEKMLKNTSDWLRANPNATKEEIQEKITELENVIQNAFDRADSMNALADEVNDVKSRPMKGLTSDEKKQVEKSISNIEKWMDSNPDADKKKIDNKKDEFVSQVVPLVKRAEARQELSDYANDVRDRIAKDKKLESRIPLNERKVIDTETKNALDWLAKNGDEASADQINTKKLDLEDKIAPIMNRAEATKDLVFAVGNLENSVKENDNLNVDERNKIKSEIQKVKDWLEKNPNASRKEADEKQQALDDLVAPILKRAEVRNDVKNYATGLQQRLAEDKEMSKMLAPEEKKLVEKKTEDVLNYLEKEKEPKISEMLKKSEDLKETVEPIFENAKARSNLDAYAKDLKNRIGEVGKDLNKDQLNNLEKAIDNSLDFLKKNPTATQTEVLVEKKKLENVANPLMETAKTNMAERKKLENLAKNIQSQLENVKQLQDLDQHKKKAIKNIALETEEWLKANPNATEQEIKDYMKGVYLRLGDHTNFKFSVWVVQNYGLGYGFSEATKWGKAPDPKKDDTKYISSFLGVNKKPQQPPQQQVATSFGSSNTSSSGPSYTVSEKDPKESMPLKVHASSNDKQDWGKELKAGAVSDIKNRFQKQISKEEQELEKKFAEMKKKTGATKGADLGKLSVQK